MAKSLTSTTKGFFRTLGYDPASGSIHNHKSGINANGIHDKALVVDLLRRPHTSNIQDRERRTESSKSISEIEFWKKKLSNKISPDQTSKIAIKSDVKCSLRSSPKAVADVEDTVDATEDHTKTVRINKTPAIRSIDNLVNVP